MSLSVLLDAGPLGMITNPKSSPENEACKVRRGVVVAGITDRAWENRV